MGKLNIPNIPAPELYFAKYAPTDEYLCFVQEVIKGIPPSPSTLKQSLLKGWEDTKKEIMMPWQVENFPTVKWLLDPTEKYRQEGRSLLMAMAYIEMTMDHPGVWIWTMDHAEPTANSPYYVRQNMFHLVFSLIQRNNATHFFQFNDYKSGFMFKGC